MYRVIEGTTGELPDVKEFLMALDNLQRHPNPEARELFNASADLIVARAPGRLDVMGGIADYSGSLVLQLPIREGVLVALQPDEQRRIQIVSLGRESDHRQTRSFQMNLKDLEGDDGAPIEYAAARALFTREASHRWTAYIGGVFLVLMRERGIRFNHGARILIDSRVPEGKGVSSSAALEVSVMFAVLAVLGQKMGPTEVALLCQKVENLVVGAPCGVMDQMTAACGRADRLLALLCQPAKLQDFVHIPEGLVVAGLDSGVRHQVTGDAYGDVRAGAAMGYRIISHLAGLRISEAEDANLIHVDDPRWCGYLANLAPSEFEQLYAAKIPATIEGEDFLARYKGTTDPVTPVQRGRTYAVLTATSHPIYENFRVRAFAELLRQDMNDRSLELLGELMYQSHASYSACGLGSERTDLLVRLSRKAGPIAGIFGAKITGGGSGGTVAVLARDAAAVQKIAEEYARESGYLPHMFSGSSPGAAVFGALRLRRAA